MNNVKKNRTGLKLLGSVNGDTYLRFTMNKTQKNQPAYSNIQPRFPGSKGNKAGQPCAGSNTNVGCKTCWGCTYKVIVSNATFNGAYPSFGSYANINPIVDLSANSPCEWQYNAIVESIAIGANNSTVILNIENNKCVNHSSILGVYFYSPVGSAGTYTGSYIIYGGIREDSLYPFVGSVVQKRFETTAKRMGAPYRNPIAGWRKNLNCSTCASGFSNQPTKNIYKDISGSDCTVHRPGIQGRTHASIIRSGLQEKRSCTDGNKKNDYAFSYRQYLNNNRCMSYERSQEKYVATGSGNCNTDKNSNRYRKSSCCDCSGIKYSNKAVTHTIYKPSNKKFSNHGAVSSGSRLDRLKLDTIRASNSNCIKGQRYKIIDSKFIDGGSYKVPNGKYDAGNPRFTGWMFNGHHAEIKGRVYNMVRYNQQPLGVPQLTTHPKGKTCIKQCFTRTLNLGSDRSTAAGNRARIPGSK